MSDFWSIFITVGTLGSIIFFAYVLIINRKTTNKPGETTGHVYDGIEELDNPLPAWWFWMYILLMVYGLGYLAYYPGLGNFKGLGNWTSKAELEADMDANEAKFAPLFARFREVPIEELHKDPDAMKMGQRLFATNCSVCHGSTATGAVGFPNLTDDSWLWGAKGADIEASIKHGRTAYMPGFGNVFNPEQISDISAYLLSVNGIKQDDQAVAKGRGAFGQVCFACHGDQAQGKPELGAPDLTDKVWLYGNSQAVLEQTISKGRQGIMPAFNDRLGEDKVHILAAYVYGLSQKK